MGEDKKEARAAGVISVASAITAVYALLKARQDLVIPKELVELIVAIAGSTDNIDVGIQQVIQELSTLAIDVQGWPPNVKRVRTFTIVCALVGTPYEARDMAIPSGMNLVIKAHPLNAVGSLVQVATTAAECLNANSSYPLVPNESIAYALENSKEIYVSSNIAGSIAIFSAEQVV